MLQDRLHASDAEFGESAAGHQWQAADMADSCDRPGGRDD
jgi:hypothetical protein